MLSFGRAAGIALTLSLLLCSPAQALVGTPASPRPAATAICTDTLLTLNFDVAPVLGATGRIRIIDTQSGAAVETIDLAAPAQTRLIGTNTTPYNFRPVIVAGTTATIFPRAGVLARGRTYHVLADAGVFVDAIGTPWTGVDAAAGWRFTTRADGPEA